MRLPTGPKVGGWTAGSRLRGHLDTRAPQSVLDGIDEGRIQASKCRASKTGEHTLEPDKPWESASLNWFSVVDDGGKYRMWYETYDVDGWPTGDDTSFCYAESADGVHWRRPDLGLFRYRDVNQTNILFRMIGPLDAHSRVHGTGVFLDRKAPSTERYKAVSQGVFPKIGAPPYFVAGMSSPDGLLRQRFALHGTRDHPYDKKTFLVLQRQSPQAQ